MFEAFYGFSGYPFRETFRPANSTNHSSWKRLSAVFNMRLSVGGLPWSPATVGQGKPVAASALSR